MPLHRTALLQCSVTACRVLSALSWRMIADVIEKDSKSRLEHRVAPSWLAGCIRNTH